MDKYKNNIVKFVISGVAVFAFGIFVGYQLNNGTLSSIQGYLFNAVGEASDSNASDANASDANASDANASDANASSANAIATDNIIYLNNFSLNSTSVKQGDRVNVIIGTSGACNSAASIVFKSTNGSTFTAKVKDITGKPYIVVPNSAVATTYTVTDVLLVGKNSDNTTFTKQYSKTGINYYNFNSSLIVTSKDNMATTLKVVLNSLSLNSTIASSGEKVYLNVKTNQKLSSLKLVFTSDDGKKFNVYAKDLTGTKPYIEIPSSTTEGTYSLTSAIASNSTSSTAYSIHGENDTEIFDFNSILEINDSDRTTFVYNNEDITAEILTKLYNASNGSEITINADSDTLINEELFNVIKGKNKKLIINYNDNQIVFNGRDITKSKTIDIAMTIDSVSSNEDISELVSDGVVVNFPDNGNLPGKALIRIKSTDEVDKILNNNVYVYIYNSSTHNFCVIDTNVKKSSDEYYEFTITHNSDYLITNEKLDSKLVVARSDDNVVSFLKGNKIYLMLVIIGILVIIAVIIVVVILKKKNKKNNDDTSINVINNDVTTDSNVSMSVVNNDNTANNDISMNVTNETNINDNDTSINDVNNNIIDNDSNNL